MHARTLVHDAADDAVVHAALWSDAQAEFVFADGTVMSFCDAMRTFVALRGRYTMRRDTHDNNDDDDDHGVRDMCFTAWTLSAYARKVTAALAVYNRFAAQPCVYADMLPHTRSRRAHVHVTSASSSQQNNNNDDDDNVVHLWCTHESMRQLVLAKHASYFARRRRVCTHASNSNSNSSNHISDDDAAHCTCSCCHDDDAVELVLTCVHRRVTLTVHASRMTFAVRWPVPVAYRSTTQDNSHNNNNNNNNNNDDSDSDTRAFVWQRQVFAVAAPPTAWARMLRFALELDADLPPSPPPHCEQAHEQGQRHVLPTTTTPPLPVLQLYTSRLPRNAALCSNTHDDDDDDDTSSRSRTRACRFSTLQRRDVPRLVACASTLQSLSYARALHDTGATVCWCYSADASLQQPHAMYWYVKQLSPPPPPQHNAGDKNDEEVVAVVREDSSVVRVGAHGSGYAVWHRAHTCRDEGNDDVGDDSSSHCRDNTCSHGRRRSRARVYFVSADGRVGLPPRVPTADQRAQRCCCGCCNEHDAAAAIFDTASSSLSSCMSRHNDDGDENSAHTRAMTTTTTAVTPLVLRGRYLLHVAHAAIRLSQCNWAAMRARCAAAPAALAQQQQPQQPCAHDVVAASSATATFLATTMTTRHADDGGSRSASPSPLPVASGMCASAVATTTSHDVEQRAYAHCRAARAKLHALLHHSACLARTNRALLHDDDGDDDHA